MVNSFSLDGYHKLIAEERLPIVRTRHLSATEQYRYYMLTRLFGMSLNTQQFRQRFDSDIHTRIWAELHPSLPRFERPYRTDEIDSE